MYLEYHSENNLRSILGSVGENVKIDSTVKFIHPELIHIGSNVRIDAYTILSAGAGLEIGSWVHIAAAVQISANQAEVVVSDFCGLSARVLVFSSNDDYVDGYLTGPLIPDQYRKVKSAPVHLNKHAVVGAGSILMPGITLGFGASVGALTFVNKSVPDFAIVRGNPARQIGNRNKDRLLALEKELCQAWRFSTK